MWYNKGLDTASVYCKCSKNVLAVIVAFASSLAPKGRKGLAAGGDTGRIFSRGRGMSWSAGVRQSRGGDGTNFGEGRMGMRLWNLSRPHPERGGRG